MKCVLIDNELYVVCLSDKGECDGYGEVNRAVHLREFFVNPYTGKVEEDFDDDGDSWYCPTDNKKFVYWDYNGMCDGYASTPEYCEITPLKEAIKQHYESLKRHYENIGYMIKDMENNVLDKEIRI